MILAILQARVSSTRLPGKVLKPILGRAMILRQVDRLARSVCIHQLVLATSDQPSDDPLAELCRVEGIPCHRGSLDDVLDRFHQAALAAGPPDHVVRLTGDCPLTDPTVVDQVIRTHLEQGNDYTSNTLEPTFPDGLDVEVVRFRCLVEAWREARLRSEREHVTPFIYARPDRYRLGSVVAETDRSHLRWTVDDPVDFQLVSRIYEALWEENPAFGTSDVLALLGRRPDLAELNSALERNAGFAKSLRDDHRV